MEDSRRKPYVEKFVKDINANDFKIAVSGVIVNKTENSFLLDDGTGQVRVASANVPGHEYLRVFGKIMPMEDGFEIQAEIIQDLSKINKGLHKKVKSLLN